MRKEGEGKRGGLEIFKKRTRKSPKREEKVDKGGGSPRELELAARESDCRKGKKGLGKPKKAKLLSSSGRRKNVRQRLTPSTRTGASSLCLIRSIRGGRRVCKPLGK